MPEDCWGGRRKFFITLQVSLLPLQSLQLSCIQAYIHNLSLQPFSQDYELVSHTTYVVFVNFIRKWWDSHFKDDTKRQMFLKTFHGNFVYTTEFLPEISFCWKCLTWDLNDGIIYNKSTYCPLDFPIYCLQKFYKFHFHVDEKSIRNSKILNYPKTYDGGDYKIK